MNEVAPRPRFARALRSFWGWENRNTSEFLGILAKKSERNGRNGNPRKSGSGTSKVAIFLPDHAADARHGLAGTARTRRG